LKAMRDIIFRWCKKGEVDGNAPTLLLLNT
jgi:hypothetical protein